MLKIVRMEDTARIKFKSCSLGMKQRIGIAITLLGDPALLTLDEPSQRHRIEENQFGVISFFQPVIRPERYIGRPYC